jgi:hypothetical protein
MRDVKLPCIWFRVRKVSSESPDIGILQSQRSQRSFYLGIILTARYQSLSQLWYALGSDSLSFRRCPNLAMRHESYMFPVFHNIRNPHLGQESRLALATSALFDIYGL